MAFLRLAFFLYLCALPHHYGMPEPAPDDYESLPVETPDTSDEADRELNPLRKSIGSSSSSGSKPKPKQDYDPLRTTTTTTTTTTRTTQIPTNTGGHPTSHFHESDQHITQYVTWRASSEKNRVRILTNVLYDLGYLKEANLKMNDSLSYYIQKLANDYSLNVSELYNFRNSTFATLNRCGTEAGISHQDTSPLLDVVSEKPVYTYSSNLETLPRTEMSKVLAASVRQAFDEFGRVSGINLVEYSGVGPVDIEVLFVGNSIPLAEQHFYGQHFPGVAAKSKLILKQVNNLTATFQHVPAIFVDGRKCWNEAPNASRCRSFYNPKSAPISLVKTLLHEIGHLFGLKHSKNPASFMYPFFKHAENDTSSPLLSTADSQLIEAIIQREKEQKITITTTVKSNATNEYLPSSTLCDGEYDGFHYLNGFIYITRGNLVWLMNPTTKLLVSTRPTTLKSLFPYYPHNRVRCLFTSRAGNPVASYNNEFYNLLTGEITNSTETHRFCVSHERNILGSVGTSGYQVLTERAPMPREANLTSGSSVPEAQLNGNLTGTGKLETSQLDYVMHIPPNMYYYFKDGFFWIKDHFSLRFSISNETLYRTQDYWLKAYCQQNVTVPTQRLYNLIDSVQSVINYLKSLIEQPLTSVQKPIALIYLETDNEK